MTKDQAAAIFEIMAFTLTRFIYENTGHEPAAEVIEDRAYHIFQTMCREMVQDGTLKEMPTFD